MKGLHPVVFLLLLILIALPFGCRSWWSFKPKYDASLNQGTNHYGK